MFKTKPKRTRRRAGRFETAFQSREVQGRWKREPDYYGKPTSYKAAHFLPPRSCMIVFFLGRGGGGSLSPFGGGMSHEN